ncbi:hypothetical protein CYMTET_16550 [Cymbomonas tetramitiformis]|uniref:Uncharacterized protein n=1 Tax=Cymbomonas tetramitiformis TaxID=36881 RepID=A0AAE0GC95_9CHLO|nr:hypothetical protein CYMTET_16550 [Cymbomonas tetramitiformis]
MAVTMMKILVIPGAAVDVDVDVDADLDVAVDRQYSTGSTPCSGELYTDSSEASDGLEQSDDEIVSDSDSIKLFVERVAHASVGRPQQVVSCGAPPCGLRPNFILRAGLISVLCFGIAGVAAGFCGIGMNNDDTNPVTEDPQLVATVQLRQHLVVIGWGPEHGGVTTCGVP